MAIGAVHPLFHVDVHQVDGGVRPAYSMLLLLRSCWRHGHLQLVVGWLAQWIVLPVEQIAVAIFFEHCAEQTPPPYLSAESVVTALEELGAMSVVRELSCTHTISIREDRLLEQYLQQSVMDTMPLPKWRQHPRLRRFLDAYRQDDAYQFPNPYWLILSVPSSAGESGKHRLQNYLSSVTPPRQAK